MKQAGGPGQANRARSAQPKGQTEMEVRRSLTLFARRAPGNRGEGRLALSHAVVRAALGRAGVRALKCEGDGATPLGRFRFRAVLYRADRGPRPRTTLPVRVIRAGDAWCEDPTDGSYNRLVKASSRPGIDRLMREDHLYDLIVVLGHNDRPRVKGRGSAIFVHLARPGYAPTAGCIALSRRDLLALLRQANVRACLAVIG
jgi:L,D-peptidoglycan transpeptidase YkuD (ErfK/YbiS/YcfS/YnhG family)